jgi:hypothetical protein
MEEVVMDAERIQGERIFLRLLTAGDDLGSYCAWMNDKEILRFTESKGKFIRNATLKYITAMNGGNKRLYGIFSRKAAASGTSNGEFDTLISGADSIILGAKDCGAGVCTEP